MESIISKFKFKGIIYLFLVFIVMAGSTVAWLYFSSDMPKKTPLRAKQVFLWHNNQNNAQTIIAKQT